MARLLTRSTPPPLDQPFMINRDSMQAEGLVGWWVFRPGRSMLADLTDGGATFALSGGATFQASIGGPGLYENANGDGALIAAAPTYLRPTANVTLVWRAIVHGAGVANSVVGMSANNTDAAPFVCWQFQRDAAQTMRWLHSQDGNINTISVASAITYGVETLWAGTCQSGSQVFYRNGVSIGSGVVSGSGFAYSATSELMVNATPAFSRNFNATTLELRVYNRALSAQEVWQLWAPDTRWELYRPAKWRTIVQGAAPAVTTAPRLRNLMGVGI